MEGDQTHAKYINMDTMGEFKHKGFKIQTFLSSKVSIFHSGESACLLLLVVLDWKSVGLNAWSSFDE